MQLLQSFNKVGKSLCAVLTSVRNTGQHLPDAVHGREQRTADLRIENECPVSQLAEKIFACMGERLELVEAQEPAGTLDRMDPAKDAG